MPYQEYARGMRIVLPFVGAFICLGVASRLNVPIAGFVLIIAAFGLVFDGGTALFARMTSTGGMSDHRQ
jgi:hypothetical protein